MHILDVTSVVELACWHNKQESAVSPANGSVREASSLPAHRKPRLIHAGDVLRVYRTSDALQEFDEITKSYAIVNRYRALHNYPLTLIRQGLSSRAHKVADDTVVTQRIKRLPAIFHKLSMRPTIRLSQIQDIAGCRAVVPTVANVYELVELQRQALTKSKPLTDYIESPQQTGYRGCHLHIQIP